MQATSRLAGALSRDCASTAVDRVLHDADGVTIGEFRCDPAHPSFRDTGPIRNAVVVFPRTSVRIRHEGSRAFVADATMITVYNRAQRYERFAVSPEGDRCDWYALSDVQAHGLVVEAAPALAQGTERPFGALERVPGSVALYRRQRALFARVRAGRASALEVEEEALSIVGDVLRQGEGATGVRSPAAEGARRRRDLAEAARAVLALTLQENRPVATIARTLGTSPYHLCRTFKAETGMTMHAYRVRLRLARALEEIEVPGRGLSAIAHELGFASHAHFVRHCRDAYGVPPTALRAQLRAGER